MSEFSTLSRKYRAALEAQRGTQALLKRGRARFAERLQEQGTPARSRWRLALPLFATLAAAGLVAVLTWPEPVLGVSLRSHPGTPADWVQTTTSEDVLDFTDGSEVRVRQGSELRVLDVQANGSHVSLEHGAAHVAVVHRQKTHWLFSAGPYRVNVVGTQFELKWDPSTGALVVAMDDGVVEVDGPGLARQRVTSRQRLEAMAQPASASLFLAAPVEPAAPEVTSQSEAPPTVTVTVAVAKHARVEKAPEKQGAKGPSWRQLADKGDAVGAMGAAEQAGFGWLANSMPKGDVLALGDVALKARQPTRAAEAWLAVRSRFGGTAAATEAALRLGHLAAEVEHDDAAAVRWFSTAEREAPSAATAPQALGNLLDTLVRARRDDEARKVATDYLRRFKNGPDAATAKAVLQGR